MYACDKVYPSVRVDMQVIVPFDRARMRNVTHALVRSCACVGMTALAALVHPCACVGMSALA